MQRRSESLTPAPRSVNDTPVPRSPPSAVRAAPMDAPQLVTVCSREVDMTDVLMPSLEAEVGALVQGMESAWNAADAAGFSAPFADDADFVNVMGMHVRGRNAIAAGHEHIFRTIYAASANRYRLEGVRALRPDVALAHVHAHLSVPAGPMAGEHDALFSLVLTREADGWRIASFQNTFVRQPGS
jgi:uncharacterized protein (TIGR02246 family)